MTARCNLSIMMIFVAESPGWPEALGFLLVSLGLFFLWSVLGGTALSLACLALLLPSPVPSPNRSCILHSYKAEGLYGSAKSSCKADRAVIFKAIYPSHHKAAELITSFLCLFFHNKVFFKEEPTILFFVKSF